MNHRTLAIALLLQALVPLTACHNDSSSFYPLAEGQTKTYELHMDMVLNGSDVSRSLPLVLTTLGPTKIAGPSGNQLDAVPVKTELAGATTLEFIVNDSSGYYTAASQSATDAMPVPRNPPSYQLHTPLAIGTAWDTMTATHLQSPSYPGNIPVTLHNTIAALDDAVTVPAGSFTGCLRVTATGTASKEERLCGGFVQISVQSSDWYCPGIGWVKGLWEEKRINCSTDGKMAAQLTQRGVVAK